MIPQTEQKEKFVHAPFNYADQVSFTLAGKSFQAVGQDGLPLGHAAHTSKTGKTGAQSNLTSNVLSVANLKLAEEMMKDFKTDIGEKGNFKADMLIVPFELRNDAWEICQSDGKIDTNNNNVNPYYGKFKVVVSDWLADPKMWFLCDSSYMKKNLFWLDRVPLEVKSEKDFNTDNWRIKGYERYSLGFVDWKWCIVNKPAA